MSFTKKVQTGFTFIEVLVVVAIIGILTTIVVANYTDARENSRDRLRQSDLKTLQLALEVYKAQNGRYPPAGCGANVNLWVGPGPLPSWGASCDEYISGLAPTYIPKLPVDPNQENQPNKGYIYRTDANGTMYKVIIHESVESLMVRSQADELSRLPEKCGVSSNNLLPNQYAIYSSGYECL